MSSKQTAPTDKSLVPTAADPEADARYRVKRRRILLLAIGAPVAALACYLLAAHLSGGALPTFGLPLGGERGELRRLAEDFWEDIQFKDYQGAARYHDAPTQELVDIPFLIQRIFQVKPEALDIMSYEVMLVDIDSSGLRGRVKTALRVKLLLTGEVRDSEVMLFFKRASPQAPWFMDLENSLRRIAPDDAKLH